MYQNPIPNVDDIRKAKRFLITPVFTYEKEMTIEEAAEGITQLIMENDGQIPVEWVSYAERPEVCGN